MNGYEKAVEWMVGELARAVKAAKRKGVVGMSRDNLAAVVDTRGLAAFLAPAAASPALFSRLFDDALAASPAARKFVKGGA